MTNPPYTRFDNSSFTVHKDVMYASLTLVPRRALRFVRWSSMEDHPVVYELDASTRSRASITSFARFHQAIGDLVLLVDVHAPGAHPVLIEMSRREGERLVQAWLRGGLRVSLDVHDILARPSLPSQPCGHLAAFP